MPILIGFGFWQLQRMQWKAALLIELAANSTAPLLDIGSQPIPQNAQFRLVRLKLECGAGAPTIRAGRNLDGQTGYSHLARCQAGVEPVTLDYGWSARPDTVQLGSDNGMVEGTLVRSGKGWLIVNSAATAPLFPSASPGLDTISNNHLSYAIQWFSFAAILAVIYALYVRRWKLAPKPPAA